MVMSTKFSVGIQEVNQPRTMIDTTSWCQIERMTHSQTNGRENVNTRKSNCPTMIKPKVRYQIYGIQLLQRMRAWPQSRQRNLREWQFCKVLEHQVHPPNLAGTLDTRPINPEEVQDTKVDRRRKSAINEHDIPIVPVILTLPNHRKPLISGMRFSWGGRDCNIPDFSGML